MVSAGYVGDDEATAATLDREGWLKTRLVIFVTLTLMDSYSLLIG